jgi:hypothetical protein
VDRAVAVRGLEAHPGRESAELIWQNVLGDESRNVRQAGVELLAAWQNDPESVRTIIELLTKETRKSGMDQRATLVLKAFGGTEQQELQGRILDYLNEFLGTPKANQLLIHSLADDLGAQADPVVLRTLILLAKAKFFDKNFGYRRCLLQGVVRVPGDDTLAYLIDTLPKLRGQVQYDVITHLIQATGENYRDDAAGWKAWWARRDQTATQKKDPPAPGSYGDQGAYYGIPIGAKRIVFALDISGSMRENGKIETAKRELCEVIRNLTPDVFFGVVAFNGRVHLWQGELVPANERNREQAAQDVLAQQTGGGTASYDALEAALTLDPEAIYFVSDGEPRTGKIVVPEEIVATIAATNRLRRVSIHAIGIGTNDRDAGALAGFMKSLAEANWGEYRAVDP